MDLPLFCDGLCAGTGRTVQPFLDVRHTAVLNDMLADAFRHIAIPASALQTTTRQSHWRRNEPHQVACSRRASPGRSGRRVGGCAWLPRLKVSDDDVGQRDQHERKPENSQNPLPPCADRGMSKAIRPRVWSEALPTLATIKGAAGPKFFLDWLSHASNMAQGARRATGTSRTIIYRDSN